MKTYDLVLLLLTPLYVVTSLLFATLGRYPDFDETGLPVRGERASFRMSAAAEYWSGKRRGALLTARAPRTRSSAG
ncbi:MAG: hypothetical protein R3E09_01765 [Novosphingobium sp.]